MSLFLGVDFGAKNAGTTAVSYERSSGEILTQIVAKGVDADTWLLQTIQEIGPSYVFIDAPLSLPLVYSRPVQGGDYFFREADKALQAMSPMFLGGLTARAMMLAGKLKSIGIKVFEVYPARAAKLVYNYEKQRYKSKDEQDFLWFAERLSALTSCDFKGLNQGNWHQIDSILAWYSGRRFFDGLSKTYGDPSEGLILV
jgi:uncharacterized protein